MIGGCADVDQQGAIGGENETRQRMAIFVQAVVGEIGNHRTQRAPRVRCAGKEARDPAHLSDVHQAVRTSCDGVRKLEASKHGLDLGRLTARDAQAPDRAAVAGPATQVADQPRARVQLQQGARELDATRGIGLCRSGHQPGAVALRHADGQPREAVAGSLWLGVEHPRPRGAQFQRVAGRIGRGLVRKRVHACHVSALQAGEIAAGIALCRQPAALGRSKRIGRRGAR